MIKILGQAQLSNYLRCASRNNLQSNQSKMFKHAWIQITFEGKFSSTKDNRQCTPCTPYKTLYNPTNQKYFDKQQVPKTLSNNFLKFQLPLARIFHHEYHRHCTPCVPKETTWNLIDSNCLDQEFYITKKNRQCTTCVPSDIICNPIDRELRDTLRITTALSKNFPECMKTSSAHFFCAWQKHLQSNWSTIFGHA